MERLWLGIVVMLVVMFLLMNKSQKGHVQAIYNKFLYDM